MRRFTTPSEGEMISPMNSGTGTVAGPGAPGPLKSGSGAGPACHWPLRTYLELAPLASAVPCARLHARAVLWEWGLPDFDDTAPLIVSELTTNAVQASAGLTGSRYDGRWSQGHHPSGSGSAQTSSASWRRSGTAATTGPPTPSQPTPGQTTGGGSCWSIP